MALAIRCPTCGNTQGVAINRANPGVVDCPQCGSVPANYLGEPIELRLARAMNDPEQQATRKALLELDQFVRYLEERQAEFAKHEDFDPEEGPELKSWIAATAHNEAHIIGKLRAILRGEDWRRAL